MSTNERYGPTKKYERLDLICVDRYGSSKNDIVSFVLSINPGLEKHGIILPENIYFNTPDLPTSAKERIEVRQQIFLWE